MMGEQPKVCTNCGSPLYAQWWDAAAVGYRCRVCGTVNPGEGPRSQVRLRWVIAPIVVGLGSGFAAFLLFLLYALSCMDISEEECAAVFGWTTMFGPLFLGLVAIAVTAIVWLLVVVVRSRRRN